MKTFIKDFIKSTIRSDLFAMSLIWGPLWLAACSATPAAPANSTSEKIAYAEAAITSVRQTCTQALTTGVLKTSGAQQCLTTTDGARTALDAAKVATSSGDDTTALGKLALANSLLLQIQQYLTAQGVK